MPVSRLAPLHRRLLLLVAAALLPVALLSVVGLVLLARQARSDVERGTVETMRAMVSAVDNDLQRSVSAVETLAASRFLDKGDLAGFYDMAERVLANHSNWDTVSVADPSGAQLINLRVPLGTPLPEVYDKESFETVLRTQRPVIGLMRAGAGDRSMFTVRVPVTQAGGLRYVVSAVVKPESFLPVLERQQIPPDGLVTIFDAHRNVVARSRAQAQFVGKPVSASFQDLLRRGGREGFGTTHTLEGEPTFAAYSLSEMSGWGVAVGIPFAAIDQPVRRSYLVFGLGIALSLALGGAAAMLMARRITGPIGALRAAAQAVGRGEPPPAAIEAGIPEVHEVAQALEAASAARRRAEDAREALLASEQEARAAAEDANRMKDEFLAMLGHELRNPLAAISSAVQVLKRDGVREDLARNARGIVERQVEHLARLMDDLLDVSRVMAGKIVLDRRPMDLAEAARQAVGTLRAAGRLERHAVSVRADAVWIDADRNRIEQIVTNLVMNAVKYSPASSPIELAVAREAGQAVLRVRDQGIGMEPELLPRVFELFVQGQRALDRAQGGLGIGLTLVRRLAELHDGGVTAQSDGPGRGSVFTVRLPAIAAPAPSQAPATNHAGVQAPRDVLVVEDNEDARAMMRAFLETEGHLVHEAADGAAGLRLAMARRYHIAFVDLGLPGMDGYELARRLRGLPGSRDMLLVALTGYGQPQDRQRALDAGFDLHLIKPADQALLRRLLAELPARAAAVG
jgi:signal transduction histidine kinase/ActR/RegA family two-component response regulator